MAALGDGNMRNLRKGDIIQLERKGYFIVDRPLISAGKPLVRSDPDQNPTLTLILTRPDPDRDLQQECGLFDLGWHRGASSAPAGCQCAGHMLV